MAVRLIADNQWSQILSRFDDANIFQTWECGAVKWGEEHLVHVVLRKSGEPVAAAQVWCLKSPIVGGGFAHVSNGPMWRPAGRTVSPVVTDRMIRSLYDEFVTRRKLLLRLYLRDRDDATGDHVLRSLGDRKLQRTRDGQDVTVMLNLSPGHDELRRNLRKTWRRQLRKAEETSVEVIQGTDDQMFGILCELYREMLARKKFTQHVENIEQLAEVQRRLPPSMKMMVFLCRHEGEFVGGQAISVLGDTAIGLISATSNKDIELKLRSTYLCDWTAIQWLKEQGFAAFDLRGYDPEKYPGPSSYKAGFGGDIVRFLGVFERSENLLSSAIVIGGKAVAKLSGQVRNGTLTLRRALS